MKHKVLLLDDDEESVISSLRHSLSSEKWEVVLAESVQDAIEKSDAGEIDLLLTTLDSRTDEGWEAIDEITEENPFLPVIVITEQPGLRTLAEAAGARALVEKPIELRALLQTMEVVLIEAAEQRVQGICEHECDFLHVPSFRGTAHRDSPACLVTA